MSNKDQNKDTEQKNGNGRSPQVGVLLRASRLRVGEDLREVSDILCIRYLYLEAIEECRYGDLPGNTYAVGFIRSYAEHLGLDGDEVVRRYRVEQSGQKSATDLAFPTPVPDSGVPKGAIVFIGVVIALLVYGGWYMTTTDESILSDLISPVPDHLKHLVTGDDAPADAATGTTPAPAVDAASTGAAETASEEVEKVLRETTAAAEQMVSDAGAEAQRTAEAAADAATSTAENVSETAQAAAVSAETTAETVVEKVQETTPGTVNNAAAPSAETAQSVSAPQNAGLSAGATVESAPPSTESAAAPLSQPTAETQTQSQAPSVSAAVAQGSEPAQTTQTTMGETPNTAEQVAAPTESVAPLASTETTAPVQGEAQASATATPQSSQTEVTAEDLNALVLRQATGVSGQVVTAPAPPETTSLASGDQAGTSGIVIRATSSSWVEIRNPANSEIVFTGLMNAGNTFNVPDIQGLTLDTGNAGALDISVDGASVPKIGGIGAVRKNVLLNAARLKAGTATNR